MAVATQTKLIDELKSVVDDLSSVFYAQLILAVGALPNGSKEELRNALIEAFPALLEPYMASSADVGASFYEASRNATMGGAYSASVANEELPRSLVSALSRYAVSPLGEDDGIDSVVSILAGAGQRHIANSARDSIRHNVARDPQAYGYARKPAPGCCEFCAMLSTRVYSDRQTALSVSGGARGRLRGPQGVGDKYHDNCRCATVPVFGDATDQFSDVIAVNPDAEKYLKAYQTAYEMSGDAAMGKRDKAILANMRQLLQL